jgi:RNA polymerase sigma factor FliA
MQAPPTNMLTKTSRSTRGYTAPTKKKSGYQTTAASERERLIEAHLPQVKFIAERMTAKLPPSVDRDDLIGAGVLGLLDAVEKFDPSRGVLFKTYAEMRVRGAMLDSLRELDWVPRSLRRRAREVEAAYNQIEQQQGRVAEGEEVAKLLGLSVNEFHDLLTELRGLTITGLEREDDDESNPHARQYADELGHTPLANYEREEIRIHLTKAIDRLPERERQVVALYYIEELTMKEVGAVLGVTESRVSQLHTQAVLRLRSSLTALRTLYKNGKQ